MNPNAGEGSSNKSPTTPTSATAEPNIGASDPLAGLENAVATAANEAATAAQTPKDQFASQFGGVMPPVELTPVTSTPAAPALDLMGQALADLETSPPAVDVLTPEPTQLPSTVENLTQPGLEQTPAEKLKKQITDSVDEFLNEVTREKVAA